MQNECIDVVRRWLPVLVVVFLVSLVIVNCNTTSNIAAFPEIFITLQVEHDTPFAIDCG
jgi:branched-subunit amino acid transport protein AzlD